MKVFEMRTENIAIGKFHENKNLALLCRDHQSIVSAEPILSVLERCDPRCISFLDVSKLYVQSSLITPFPSDAMHKETGLRSFADYGFRKQ